MKQFAARARAEEAVFANRRKQDLVLDARGLRRLAEWAFSEMANDDSEAAADYASALIRSRLEGKDPLKSVATDLREAGVDSDEKAISRRFDRYVSEERNAA